jgi:hypothetical protein
MGQGGAWARDARPKSLDYGEGIQDDDGSSKWGDTTQASENTGGGQVEHGTLTPGKTAGERWVEHGRHHLLVRPLRG